MNRPKLSKSLTKTDFQNWYWLKLELVEFCREQHLPVSGSKEELVTRIERHLSGERAPRVKRASKGKSPMPNSFDKTTVIAEGWRCSQSLRQYFEAEFGKSFGFNEPLRTFISTKAGHTLEEAAECYRASLLVENRPITKQFEYNIHMREFHKNNPDASHADAVDAWWKKRGK